MRFSKLIFSRLIFTLILSLFFAASLLLISCTEPNAQTQEALGTVCTVNLFERGSKKIYGKIFTRLFEIDSRFNVNKSDSDISKVNENAGLSPVKVHEDVAEVLSFALEIAEKSQGAFDPSIGPLVRLWGINTEHEKLPSDEEIEKAMSLVDWKKVHLEGGEVFLEEKGMSLDLGGIAKGYAADQIVKILGENKIPRAVIDLGGNIYVYGKKRDKSPWKIGIKNPSQKESAPLLTLTLEDSASIVTSGIYERFFEQDGIVYHHILDPKTGRPSNTGILSTTIVDSSSMKADALSTTAFLLGPEKYFSLFDSKAIFIDKNLEVKSSEGLEIQKNMH